MYRPGDWWMICPRCGAKYRKSDMKEHWTGQYLCELYCWEPRHPQDFVESIEENPSVPVSRPDIPQVIGETTLDGDVAAGATSATLTAIAGLSDGEPVGILLDDSTVHWTFIDGDLDGSVITLGSPTFSAAADGNTVYLPSLNNETWQ